MTAVKSGFSECLLNATFPDAWRKDFGDETVFLREHPVDTPVEIAMRFRLLLPALLLLAGPAAAYIHFTPMTLPKMCKESLFVRVLTVAKADAEAGVVVFALEKDLKATKGYAPVPFERHSFRTDPKAAKPYLEKLTAGTTVVLFSIENAKVAGCQAPRP